MDYVADVQITQRQERHMFARHLPALSGPLQMGWNSIGLGQLKGDSSSPSLCFMWDFLQGGGQTFSLLTVVTFSYLFTFDCNVDLHTFVLDLRKILNMYFGRPVQFKVAPAWLYRNVLLDKKLIKENKIK